MDTPEQQHSPEPSTSTPNPVTPSSSKPYPQKSFWDKRTALRLALIVLMGAVIGVGVLGVVSSGAQPGEPLYTIKTEFTEPAIGATKLTSAQRSSYQLTLLERRLAELTLLAGDTSTSSPELLTVIAGYLTEHANAVVDIFNQNDNLATESTITTLARVETVMQAAETLADSSDELSSLTDSLSDTESRAGDALKQSVSIFVSNNATDTIQSFITLQITAVGEEVVTTAPGSRAQNIVVRRIEEANESIADSKWGDAIMSLLRARQAIAVDGYLFDSERGPVDGVPIEAGPVPEGN